MRNEIFASHGYRFKDPALAAQFKRFRGYHPHLSTVDDFLSDVERENVKRLLAGELEDVPCCTHRRRREARRLTPRGRPHLGPSRSARSPPLTRAKSNPNPVRTP
jgi:hypothetical protein